MKPAVLIVNWNSGGHLRNLIGSLIPLASRLSNILVADNGSQDDSCRDLPRLDNLTVDQPGRNLGFAGACNAGIRRLEADWILLLNPDVIADPDSLERLFEHAREASGCGIVFGPLQGVETGRWQIEFQVRRLPTPWSLFSDAVFLDELLASGSRVEHRLTHPGDVEQPAAAYWLLRRQAWEELGGFDEEFHPAWFEDVDFCRRLLAAGWRIRCFPDCPIRHVGGLSLSTLGRREFTRIYYRNMLRYVRKHHSLAWPLLWLPVRLGSWVRQVAVP